MRDRAPGTLTILIRLLFGSWRGFFRSSAIIAAVAVAGLAVLTGAEALFFPWARSFTGGQTLTGEWYGEFAAPAFGVQRVYVEVEGHLASRCVQCRRIEGRARICDSRGRVRDFDVTGDYEYSYDLDFEHKMGFDGDIIAGYDFGQIRAEAELGYKTAEIDEVVEDFGDGEVSVDADGDLSVWSVMGNLL